MPSSRDAEMRAEALFRSPVGPGDYVEGPAYRHPDPRADRERRAICEAELAQAAGRGRGVNRTAETPLQIDLLCPYPIGLPADETVAWHAVRQDWLFECAARGLVPESARASNEVLSRILPRFASAAKVASARTYLQKKCGFKMPVVAGPVAPAHLDHAFGVSSWPRITAKGRRYACTLRVDPARGCPATFARSILGRDCEVTRDGTK